MHLHLVPFHELLDALLMPVLILVLVRIALVPCHKAEVVRGLLLKAESVREGLLDDLLLDDSSRRNELILVL